MIKNNPGIYALIAGLICLSLALINLPFVIDDGWGSINLIPLIFCGALAIFNFIMAYISL